ncbi:acetyltransferase [Entomohabitans teleogrylli]|uniref:acetyltransferase n=1 Tax=Entomohabitans teleogrylli TaxID=1384589 RepID=UPI00073D8C60|nr:acetyltransferase [Entomohabitans teleogrylli]
MLSEIQIRAASRDDDDRLIALWQRSVTATHLFLTPEDIDGLAPVVSSSLPLLNVYVAEDSSVISGFIAMDGEKIEMLFIDDCARGKGIGRLLLDFARRQSPQLKVDVNEQNPQARGFYEHYGFHIIGRSSCDGQGNPFPLLHMELG